VLTLTCGERGLADCPARPLSSHRGEDPFGASREVSLDEENRADANLYVLELPPSLAASANDLDRSNF